TAQAAFPLVALLPETSFGVTAPTTLFPANGGSALTATGLDEDAHAVVHVQAGTAAAGQANSSGVATAAIRAGADTRIATVRVTGSRSGRVGTTTMRVLGRKTLGASAVVPKIRRSKGQVATFTGLAAGEPVRVFYRGVRVST